jgi:single-strand DNA-binding protein
MIFNQITLIGRLGKDPELSITSGESGRAVARFSLAIDQPGDLKTMWMNVIAWERLAENVEKYIGKGDQVLVQGRSQRREYTDRNGMAQVVFEVIASTVLSLEKKKGGEAPPAE